MKGLWKLGGATDGAADGKADGKANRAAGRGRAQLPASFTAVCMKTATTEAFARARQAIQPP